MEPDTACVWQSASPRRWPRRPRPATRLTVLVAAWLATGTVSAQISTKIIGGDWHNPAAWSTLAVPTANTGVRLISETTVAKPAVARVAELDALLTIGGDEGRLTLDGAMSLGTGYDTEGTLVVDGKPEILLQAGGLSVGAINRGTVRVRQGTVGLTGSLRVASSLGINPPDQVDHRAYGLLEIRGVGAAVSAGAMGLGSFATSATRPGDGELLVAEGGRLSTGGGGIVNGTVTVQDVGSSWLLFLNNNDANPDDLSVEGTLLVRNGGTVGFDHTGGAVSVFGDTRRGSRGALTVTGAGSRLIVPTTVSLGRANSIGGTLTVSDGALVQSGAVTLQNQGTAQVLGAGAFWQIAGLLTLQSDGLASFMTIAGGAGVSADNVRISTFVAQAAQQAVLTVRGAGSRLLVAEQLAVGRGGQSGLLQVLAGARVDSASATVGENFRARGDVVVDGSGSRWDVGGVLTLGAMGVGVAQVSNGGLLSADSLQLGLTVDPSIRNQVGGSLFIGGSGAADAPGRLQVAQRIQIAQTGRIVFNHTGSGHRFETVVVSGAPGEGLIDQRAGVTILDADLSLFTGDTQVNGGTLLVDGVLGSPLVTVADGATLGGSGVLLGNVLAEPGAVVSPGNSPGRLAIDGALTLQAGASLLLELVGGTAGTQHDQLLVGGDLLLAAGTLELAFLGGFAPAAGQQFNLFQVAGSFSGPADIHVTGLAPGWLFSASFDPAAGGFALRSLNDGVPTSPVPMPASHWLLTLGLAVLAWRRPGR